MLRMLAIAIAAMAAAAAPAAPAPAGSIVRSAVTAVLTVLCELLRGLPISVGGRFISGRLA